MLPTASLNAFDEAFYLASYPDVADAVRHGTYASSFEHYEQCGRNEGRLGAPAKPAATMHPLPDAVSFDEAFYLQANPDIADAVAKGLTQSGFAHWTAHGRTEGRLPWPGYHEDNRVNIPWYLQVYPVAAGDIAAGRARDADDHYRTLGQYRGYLPNSYAKRAINPDAARSRFGGLWLDQGNAPDLIEGKRQLGRLTTKQAAALQHWADKGYLILRQAIPRRMVAKAAAELDRAYDGQAPGLRFECPALGGYAPIAWTPSVKDNPAKALDLHWSSSIIRDLIFAEPIRDLLELMFDRRALAAQSLTFLRGSTQGYHQDTLYVPFSLPTQFVASWIALEDVTPGGGELTYYPGSHKLPEYLYGDRYKTLWDARRELGRNSIYDEMKDYSHHLEQRCKAAGLKPETLLAKKGDVLLWHADLVHGGLPITNGATRRSVVTHYAPSEVVPLPCEQGGTSQRSYKGVARYATRYYAP